MKQNEKKSKHVVGPSNIPSHEQNLISNNNLVASPWSDREDRIP